MTLRVQPRALFERKESSRRIESLLAEGTEVKLLGDDKPGYFAGYLAVFGNVDAYGDVVQRGAFKESLKDWAKQKALPPMLLNHGGFGAMDDLPVGVWDKMTEDDVGLAVEGHLIALESETGMRIHAAMKEKALTGMSIGYRAKEFTFGTKPDEPRRTLKKVDLVEGSVVTFPANTLARIKEAKGEPTIRDAEKALRDVGFSTADAKAILANGFNFKSASHRDVGAGACELVDALRRNASLFKPH